ncbi:MAG: hypothetical protein HDS08_00805 [Bacteroides sp.]|nr:hypothetical protein [Bacteroides sp.]
MNRGISNRNNNSWETELSRIRETAVGTVVRWAQSDRNELTMRSQVNRYMEASGAHNSPGGEEGIMLGRRIVAREILLGCITPLSREQLRKAEGMLLRIAEDDAPRVKRGRGI